MWRASLSTVVAESDPLPISSAHDSISALSTYIQETRPCDVHDTLHNDQAKSEMQTQLRRLVQWTQSGSGINRPEEAEVSADLLMPAKRDDVRMDELVEHLGLLEEALEAYEASLWRFQVRLLLTHDAKHPGNS